jgi:hypothetical protein
MGSKARRTALSVAGLALASGATLGLAAPASASTHAGDESYSGGYENDYDASHERSAAVAGSYTKVEKTEVRWAAQDKQKASASSHDRGWRQGGRSHDDCDDQCAKDRHRWNDHRSERGHRGGHQWKKHDRLKGFHRSYQACKSAGVRGVHRGWWDSYDCDFTKRGYKGWHHSWNKWGQNDWRCHGTWVLNTRGY